MLINSPAEARKSKKQTEAKTSETKSSEHRSKKALEKDWGSDPLQGRISYSLNTGFDLELKVTKIPTSYSLIRKDIEGNLLPPKLGEVIVSTNTEPISIGSGKVLPKGSKFYSRVVSITSPERFHKDGHISLEFFKLETAKGKVILDKDSRVSYDTKKKGNLLKKIGTVGGYTFGGALAGAYLSYKIGGLSLGANPYALGGALALGGVFGLAAGIFKKGKLAVIEPGSEMKLKLQNDWVFSVADAAEDIELDNELLDEAKQDYMANHKKANPDPVEIELVEVKKKKNLFGDKCLAITFNYKNKTKEELRYSSFKLVDSMGKEYWPSPKDMSSNLFGILPRAGELTLYYATEFRKAIHRLQAHRYYDQKILGSREILL